MKTNSKCQNSCHPKCPTQYPSAKEISENTTSNINNLCPICKPTPIPSAAFKKSPTNALIPASTARPTYSSIANTSHSSSPFSLAITLLIGTDTISSCREISTRSGRFISGCWLLIPEESKQPQNKRRVRLSGQAIARSDMARLPSLLLRRNSASSNVFPADQRVEVDLRNMMLPKTANQVSQ